MRALVTGGAGFIGSALARRLVRQGHERVIVLDKLTYSGSRTNLDEVADSSSFCFVEGDIGDSAVVAGLLADERVDTLIHLAAESHVDRSLDGPAPFIETNVVGTFRLLEAALAHWRTSGSTSFRFHHVSTDEVFGDLPFDDSLFTEDSAYKPSSPYSASKAASDHLVRAWHESYGLPVVLSNCSNNYGPYHFPEKLIPLTILNALEGREISVYGTGTNVRDWLHVDDHAEALELIAARGTTGESYNVGGRAERTNLQVVEALCDLVDERVAPLAAPRRSLIRFVDDRPGHDRRYAIDASKIECALGWVPRRSFEDGLAETVDWFLEREDWWRPLRERYAGGRIGLG